MANKATVGNKLYLYGLLRSKLGTGKQEFLPNVEKILQDDGVYPQDMGYDSTRSMFADFGEFVTLTDFKGGRTYIRLMPRPDWDTILDSAKPEDDEKPVKGGKAMPWKHKKVTKQVRPVKPRHHVTAKELKAKEAQKRAAQEKTSALAQAESEPKSKPQPQAEAAKAEVQEEVKGKVKAQVEQQEESQPKVEAASGKEPQPTADSTPSTSERSVVPKQHRIAITVVDEKGEQVIEATGDKPTEPQKQHVGATKKESVPNAAVSASPASTTKPQATAEAATPSGDLPTDSQEPQKAFNSQVPQPQPESVQVAQPQPTPVQTTQPQPASPEPNPQSKQTAPETPVPEPAHSPATQVSPAVQEAENPSTHFSTAEPFSTPAPVQEAPRAHAVLQTLAARQAASTPSSLPVSFLEEVHCKDELLSVLTRMLPFDVDLATVLEQDWQVARATGTATGTRSRVVFPIRYLRPDGTAPIELTLRRSSRAIAGKHWTLALVDGDDGTGKVHEAAGLEGAPQGDEGAWADLSASLLAPDRRVSPLRNLASEYEIGSWDNFLGSLISMAAPERWDYPDEGVGHASRLGILREYVCVTLYRLVQQGKVATAPDGRFRVLNTGLMTPMTEDIFACFAKGQSSTAWKFQGFAVAGSGELGRAITATFDPLPQPATYVESLDQVMPRANKLVAIDYRAIIGKQLDRFPRGFLTDQLEGHEGARPHLQQALDEGATPAQRHEALRELGRTILADPGLYRRFCLALDDACAMAMRRVRASFRLCAPAYDPQTGLVDLLLPLALIQDGRADCALTLESQPSGNYQASTILTLPRAYACARVISKYQPAWLLPKDVLEPNEKNK